MQLNLFEYMVEEVKLTMCPRCGHSGVMELNCKRLCTNCGYKEDCSDLFVEELNDEPRV